MKKEKNMKFHFRYVYTYFHFDDILNEGAYDETFDATAGSRFTLTHQEDGSFLVGGVGHDAGGEYAILTFPNKDNLLIHRGEEVELAYDEFTDTMGDNCHNVYEGTVALE